LFIFIADIMRGFMSVLIAVIALSCYVGARLQISLPFILLNL